VATAGQAIVALLAPSAPWFILAFVLLGGGAYRGYSSSGFSPLVIVLIVVLLILLFGGGSFYYGHW